MAKTKVTLNNQGFRELRTSPSARSLIRAEAQKVADRAGPGFEVLPEEDPRNRAHRVVAASNYSAARKNARENTLLRAVGGSL